MSFTVAERRLLQSMDRGSRPRGRPPGRAIVRARRRMTQAERDSRRRRANLVRRKVGPDLSTRIQPKNQTI